MIDMIRQYGRYGYRRIAALLRDAGWLMNDKWVERLWRREGLKVPMKQSTKGRLWLNDGACVRLSVWMVCFWFWQRLRLMPHFKRRIYRTLLFWSIWTDLQNWVGRACLTGRSIK